MMFHKNSAIMNFKPKVKNKANNAKHDSKLLDFENANTGNVNIQDQNLADNDIWKDDNHNNSESVSDVESKEIKIVGEEHVDDSVDASGNLIFEYFPYILTSLICLEYKSYTITEHTDLPEMSKLSHIIHEVKKKKCFCRMHDQNRITWELFIMIIAIIN
jgi:hypothetical protein